MSNPRGPVFYDPETDSMYVEIRTGAGASCHVDNARDLVVDLDSDGLVVGYDIQHASRHPDVIAEALAELRRAQGLSAAA